MHFYFYNFLYDALTPYIHPLPYIYLSPVLSGHQVHNTELFDMMHTAGELTNVAVAYRLGDIDITFTVSIYGSIVMYSNIVIEEYLDFFDELFDL